MTYEKKSNSFAENLKHEMMEFRGRLESIEAQIKNGLSGTAQPQPEVDTTNVDESVFPTFNPSTVTIEDKVSNLKEYSRQLSDTTYALHEAAIATRGYAMLLDQMGLSKEQTKLVHDLEEGTMMILKAAQALKLLMLARAAMEAGEGDPFAIASIVLAGGMASSSAAYAHKMTGGGV